jgi:hypothetical protein
MAGLPNQKRFYFGQPGTTTTTLYTAPSNTTANPSPGATAIVKEIVLANTTANAATVTIGINGTSAANQIIPAISVGANDTKILSGLNLMLNASDTLQGLQGTASAVTVVISGVEVQ